MAKKMNIGLGSKEDPKAPNPPQTPETKEVKSQDTDFEKKILEKFAQLEAENQKLMSRLRDSESDVAKIQAANRVEPASIMKAPSGNRPKHLQKLENMFKMYGVGEKTMKFVRKKYKGELVMKPENVRTDGTSVVRMVYTKNHESPFVEDHPSNMLYESEPIVFIGNDVESSIIVTPNRANLQRFLLAHQDFGKTFELEDKEELARKELEVEESRLEAITYVKSLYNDELKLKALITHLSSFDTALNIGDREAKLFLIEVAKDQYRDVLDYADNEKENADSLVRYRFGLGLKRGLVNISNGVIYFSWNRQRLGNVDNNEGGDSAFIRIIAQHPEYYHALNERLG